MDIFSNSFFLICNAGNLEMIFFCVLLFVFWFFFGFYFMNEYGYDAT